METRYLVSKILVAVAVLCLVAILIISNTHSDELKGGNAGNSSTSATTGTQIQYEQVDLQTMLDELDANAMRAEETYQDKYIEITGEIRNFDSDGKYISIRPCGASILTERVMCYLTDSTHKAFLLEKAVGDVVTIKGKVSSIGEVLGYSVKIAEISD